MQPHLLERVDSSGAGDRPQRGSSSSKTSTARQLQAMLLEPWVAVSIEGTVEVGSVFTRLERPWAAGIAATARAGAPVVVDDVRVATSRTSPEDCAHSVATRLQLPSSTATTLGRQVAT